MLGLPKLFESCLVRRTGVAKPSGWAVCLVGLLLGLPFIAEAQEKKPPKDRPQARLIKVSLPLLGTDDRDIRNAIEQAISQLPKEPRPVIVLEFANREETGGESSDFFRALSLATFLSSPEVSNGARLVAFVPGAVKGHAVLPVMACQQLVVSQQTELGAAGIKTDQITDTMRSAYREYSSRRGVIPPPVAIAMLDRGATLYRIQTTDTSSRFALQKERNELDSKGLIDKESTLVPEGDFAVLNGIDLRTTFGFASHMASTREELAEALNLPSGVLQEDPSLGGKWRGLLIVLDGRLNAVKVTRAQSGLQKKLRSGEFNLVCVRISSSGGAPVQTVRLASYLAALDASEVRTVGVVDGEARADAALLALACDDVIMLEDSHIGGSGGHYMKRRDLRAIKPVVMQMAARKGRSWSLYMALLDNSLSVSRYQRIGADEVGYFCKEEFEEKKKIADWKLGDDFDVSKGLNTIQAVDIGLAKRSLSSFDEIKIQYQLEEELEEAEAPWIVHQLERLATQPWFPRTLLFIAFFALMSEASAPGLGAPGFVAAICFILFFWTQFFNHSANWLEVLLFVGGLVFIGIEIFALPGFGIFGIGGILMVISGIVLASQTFVIPMNQYQLEQLPGSILTIGAAMGGGIFGVFAVRKFLPHTPYFNRLILKSPVWHEQDQKESLVSWGHLAGQTGVTATRLGPAGKARFGDDLVDVVSDGEMIDAHVSIEVLEVVGNRVVVTRAVES